MLRIFEESNLSHFIKLMWEQALNLADEHASKEMRHNGLNKKSMKYLSELIPVHLPWLMPLYLASSLSDRKSILEFFAKAIFLQETTEDEKNTPCQIIFNPESEDKDALRKNLSYLNYFEADFNKPEPVKKRELLPDPILDPIVSFKADILAEIREWQKRLLLEKLPHADFYKLTNQNGSIIWVNQDFYLINLYASLPDALLQRILAFDKAEFAKLPTGAVSAKANAVVEADSIEEAFETEVVDCLVAAIKACSDEKDPTVKGVQFYQSKASLPNKLFSSQAALTQVLKPVFDKFEEMVPVKRKGPSPTP